MPIYTPKKRARFVSSHRSNMLKGIAYGVIDYSELVMCTGRCIRDDKADHIAHHHNCIIKDFNINGGQ